ncbi:POK9 protein, partial [Anhinga anhinga]|nr:POK9 protein [Anhinga anhinga]
RGSAGLDVTTAEDLTLWDTRAHQIPLNVRGPMGKGCSALLLGCSSTTMTGLFVLPRVIDADFGGQISAMVWTPSPPLLVPRGTRLAQLILFRAIVTNASETERGAAGFGSTGQPAIFWATDISQHRPTVMVTLWNTNDLPRKIQCRMLVDTGADVTVIA